MKINVKEISKQIKEIENKIEELSRDCEEKKSILKSHFNFESPIEDILLSLQIKNMFLDLYEADENYIIINNLIRIIFDISTYESSFIKESLEANKNIICFGNKKFIVAYNSYLNSLDFDLNDNNLLDIIKVFNLDINVVYDSIKSHEKIDDFIKIVKMIDSLPLEFM